MKKVVSVALLSTLITGLTACSDNPNKFTGGGAGKQVVSSPAKADSSGEQALKFLSGAQSGDRVFMFEAANLTGDLINDCREKLINPTKFKQTVEERTACENVLRTSGEIDYFSGPLKKLFPKSAKLQATRSDALAMADGARRFDHTVTVTYDDMNDALSDKTGKKVKVMAIHLFQTSYTINGRVFYSFSFDGKGFDRFADRDFEVITYY